MHHQRSSYRKRSLPGTILAGLALAASRSTAAVPPVRFDAGVITGSDQWYGYGGLVAADFNRDGKIDLAWAGSGDYASAGVKLSNGDGTFRDSGLDASMLLKAGETDHIAVGDFNGDGAPDLAVSTGPGGPFADGSTGFAILLGNGDGTFRKGQAVTGLSGSGSLVVADLNGDGKLDLIWDNQVFLGDGKGGFQPVAQRVPLPKGARIVVGDFNGDGHVDIATGDPGGVAILLGKGDGTFHTARVVDAPAFFGAPIVADVNGDGKVDLILPGSHGYAGVAELPTALLLGNGDGTFRAATTIDGVYGPMAVVDVNGDGKLDLVSPNSLRLGNGDGTFRPATVYQPDDLNTLSLLVADFDGDNRPDVLLAGDGDLTFFHGNGDGTFRTALHLSLNGSSACLNRADAQVAAADFTGDGKIDVLVALVTPGGARIDGLLGHGDGTFDAAVRSSDLDLDSLTGRFVVADVNGDGKPDIVAAGASHDTGDVAVYLGNGDLTFRAGANYAIRGSYIISNVAVGDFNGDGRPDLAVTSSSTGLSVLLGNGDGSFRAAGTYVVDGTVVAAADLNGDGKADLVLGSDTSEFGQVSATKVTVLLGNGDGTFQDAVDYPIDGMVTEPIIADCNHDGKPDIIALTNYGRTVTVLLGVGDGTFRSPVDSAESVWEPNPTSMQAADVNADGNLDLVVTEAGDSSNGYAVTSGAAAILLGHGDGTFEAGGELVSGLHPQSVAVADVNGDGRPDIITTQAGYCTSLDSASVLINRGADDTSTKPTMTFLVGDLNGDGKLSVADATLALRFAIGLAQPTDAQKTAAGSHALNVAFATLLLRTVLGLNSQPL